VNDSQAGFPIRQFNVSSLKGFLYWRNDRSSVEEGCIDLLQIVEIRYKHRLRMIKVPKASCFSIYHGDEFNLNLTVLFSQCGETVAREWVTGLQEIVKEMQDEWILRRVERIIEREFSLAATAGRNFNLVENKHYETIKNPSTLINYFKNRGMDKSKRISLNLEFDANKGYNKSSFGKLLLSKLEYQFEEGNCMFGKIKPIANALKGEAMVTQEKFREIFSTEEEETALLFQLIAEENDALAISFHTFALFLFSEHNSILDPELVNKEPDEEYLSAPMSHYWINSSHNTYLTGNQYSSMSSVECYVRALRLGCRCIELDCWNGKNGSPEILHGHTMTSTVPLKDVLEAIAEHAFSTTNLPLTLSIENHCNIEQQDMMAHLFKTLFKEKLLKEPVDENEDKLPSPWSLRNKILIKNRKLKSSDKDDQIKDDNDEHETSSFQGLVNVISADNKKHPKFANLFSNTGELHFSKITDPDSHMNDGSIIDDVLTSSPMSSPNSKKMEESSQSKSWYHGNISRVRTEELLLSERRQGSWLVRDSNRFKPDYTLCILHNDKIVNIRIHKDYKDRSEAVFFLDDNNPDHPVCDSLEILIEHYQTYPIKANLQLLHAVCVPEQHLRMIWFYQNISRDDAARALRDDSVADASFLIRQKSDKEFVISFRSDRDGPVSVKHGKITKIIDEETPAFRFGDSLIFPSLVALVEYYKRNAFYKGVELGEPVDRALVNRVTSQEIEEHNGEEYVDHTSRLQVIAQHKYEADDHNELSINAGDKIIDVEMRQKDWWFGKIPNSEISGWFPANYVQVCDQEDKEEDLLNEANDGKLILSTSFEITQGPDKVITIKDVAKRKSMRIGKSNQKEGEAVIVDLFQALTVFMDRNQQSTLNHQSEAPPKMLRLSRNLSDVVVYCQATTWSEEFLLPNDKREFRQMSSIGESKIQKYLTESYVKSFLDYNTFQISRTYPKGARIHSENYNPISCWNAGVQMVALNFQTPDLAMQLNHAKFAERKGCGYVRKPNYLLSSVMDGGEKGIVPIPVSYNPCSKQDYTSLKTIGSKHYGSLNPKTLILRIIGGRNIFGLGKTYQSLNTSNIDYSVEIWGIDADKQKHRFKQEGANTFNPVFDWKELNLKIHNPDLAFLRFVISSPDPFGESLVKAVAVFPVNGLRQGIRSIPLMNTSLEPIELAALLVECSITD